MDSNSGEEQGEQNDGKVVVEDEGEELEQLLSKDNEMDLIFYNYTRLLENIRSQCLNIDGSESDKEGEVENIDYGDDDGEEDDYDDEEVLELVEGNYE